MKLGECDLVRYEDKYLGQTIHLLSMLWGADPHLSRAYFEWKHLRNPYSSRPIVYLVLDRDRVICVRSFYATCWQISDPPHRSACVLDADTVVHPEYRRRGFLEQSTSAGLRDLASTSYTHVITLSGGPQSSALNFKLGWRSVAVLHSLQWSKANGADGMPQETGVKKAVRNGLGRIGGYFRTHGGIPSSDSPFAELERNIVRTNLQGKGKIVVAKGAEPEAMSALVRSQSRGGRFRHVRDEEFFRWRFQNPLSTYRFLFRQTDRLNGYLVLRKPNHYDTSLINIVDWETDRLDVLRELLEAATRMAGSASLRTWSATLSEEEQKVFREVGFGPVCSRPETFIPLVLVRPTNLDTGNESWRIGDRNILEPGAWDLRPIYSDDL